MHGERFPILVKFIFTTARLSLQVHPNDRQAEGGHGKTEMWHILRAEPGATLALGIPRAHYRASGCGKRHSAARSSALFAGSRFAPARPSSRRPGSSTPSAPASRWCEIQQNSDITYRLYDYGRPRELHLDQGVAVAQLDPHPGASAPVDLGDGRRLLARCEYFVAEALEWACPLTWQPDPGHLDVLIVLEGAGTIAGRAIGPGEVWLVPAGAAPFPVVVEAPLRLLRTYLPPRSA